jgi:hypothetical protein
MRRATTLIVTVLLIGGYDDQCVCEDHASNHSSAELLAGVPAARQRLPAYQRLQQIRTQRHCQPRTYERYAFLDCFLDKLASGNTTAAERCRAVLEFTTVLRHVDYCRNRELMRRLSRVADIESTQQAYAEFGPPRRAYSEKGSYVLSYVALARHVDSAQREYDEAIRTLFTDPDATVRQAVLFGVIADPWVCADTLQLAINDPAPNVRWMAVTLAGNLYQTGSGEMLESSAEIISRGLLDSDPSVAEQAREVLLYLRGFGKFSVAPPDTYASLATRTIANEPVQQRYATLRVIDPIPAISDAEAGNLFRFLEQAKPTGEWFEQLGVDIAISRLSRSTYHTPEVMAVTRKWLQCEVPDVRIACQCALVRLDPALYEEVATDLEATIVQELASPERLAEAITILMTHGEKSKARRIFEQATRGHGLEAMKPIQLREILPDDGATPDETEVLRLCLGHTNEAVRVEAARILLRNGNVVDRACEVLVNVIRTGDYPQEVANAWELLAQHAPRLFNQILMDQFQSNPGEAAVTPNVVTLLRPDGDTARALEPYLNKCIQQFRSSKGVYNARMGLRMLTAIGSYRHAETLSSVIMALESGSVGVRVDAAKCLGVIGTNRDCAVKRLMRARHDESDMVRQAAYDALLKLRREGLGIRCSEPPGCQPGGSRTVHPNCQRASKRQGRRCERGGNLTTTFKNKVSLPS